MNCSRSGEYYSNLRIQISRLSLTLIDFSERKSELLYSFASSEQLVMHVLAYAEVLFRWELLHKRIELLKAVDPFLRLPSDSYFNSDHSQLGTSPFASCMCLLPHPVTYLFIMWSSSWDRCIHPMHSVRSIDSFSDSINLFCLWHPPRNAQMFCMPPSRQRRVVLSHVLHYSPF
jgi:hypothetical protein